MYARVHDQEMSGGRPISHVLIAHFALWDHQASKLGVFLCLFDALALQMINSVGTYPHDVRPRGVHPYKFVVQRPRNCHEKLAFICDDLHVVVLVLDRFVAHRLVARKVSRPAVRRFAPTLPDGVDCRRR